MAKMWAGRTVAETAKVADDFNSSIAVDQRMYRQDIMGSLAHAAMLSACGIIAPGKVADLILVDFTAPNLTPCHDVEENLVFSAHGSNVTGTDCRISFSGLTHSLARLFFSPHAPGAAQPSSDARCAPADAPKTAVFNGRACSLR